MGEPQGSWPSRLRFSILVSPNWEVGQVSWGGKGTLPRLSTCLLEAFCISHLDQKTITGGAPVPLVQSAHHHAELCWGGGGDTTRTLGTWPLCRGHAPPSGREVAAPCQPGPYSSFSAASHVLGQVQLAPSYSRAQARDPQSEGSRVGQEKDVHTRQVTLGWRHTKDHPE